MSAGLAEGQRRSYMGDGSLREPSPIRQGISGGAVKDKNRNPEGTPDLAIDEFSNGERGQIFNLSKRGICDMNLPFL